MNYFLFSQDPCWLVCLRPLLFSSSWIFTRVSPSKCTCLTPFLETTHNLDAHLLRGGVFAIWPKAKPPAGFWNSIARLAQFWMRSWHFSLDFSKQSSPANRQAPRSPSSIFIIALRPDSGSSTDEAQQDPLFSSPWETEAAWERLCLDLPWCSCRAFDWYDSGLLREPPGLPTSAWKSWGKQFGLHVVGSTP